MGRYIVGYEFLGIKKRIPLLLTMPHTFAGYVVSDLTRRGIPEEDIRVTPFGVRVMTDAFDTVKSCRLYDRLYLTVPIKRGDALREKSAVDTIRGSMLRRILDSYLRGDRPIPARIRVEVPAAGSSKKATEKARDEEKRLVAVFSEAVAGACPGIITSAATGYECEIYFPERPDGTFGIYIWFSSMGDKRFSYRRAVEPTSMSAVRAATMIEMLHPYIIEANTVLDPMCGTGTLIIERKRHGDTGNVFATDISAQMIAQARENAALASEHIHFIQRDYFDFTYDGYFDEIITELPDLYHRNDREKKTFFKSFLKKSISITTEGAIMGILTGDADIFSSLIAGFKELEVEKRIAFGGKREVFILRCV